MTESRFAASALDIAASNVMLDRHSSSVQFRFKALDQSDKRRIQQEKFPGPNSTMQKPINHLARKSINPLRCLSIYKWAMGALVYTANADLAKSTLCAMIENVPADEL